MFLSLIFSKNTENAKKKKYMLAIQDDPEVPEHGQDEEANLCINIDFEDNKTLEVNLRNNDIFFTNKMSLLSKRD